MNKIIKTVQFGDEILTIETGEIARQASASVVVRLGDTMVLVTAVGRKEAKEGQSFFPLTVNCQERIYAAGRIPGGFKRREGPPTEKETLTARLTDRPIRPLFPKDFKNEVQVVATVLSMDPIHNPDVLSIIGASAALTISGMPFQGPIGAARVGYKEGVYSLNPAPGDMPESDLDLVVAGTADAILMVESEAKELSEEIMLGAVLYGHEMMQGVIKAIKELAEEVGNPAWDWQSPVEDLALKTKIAELATGDLTAAYLIKEKQDRQTRLCEIREQILEKLQADDEALEAEAIQSLVAALEKAIVREQVLSGQPRIDGRDLSAVRPISVRTSVLPRTHGSALFTRGETQAIVVATLGSERDAQLIDDLMGNSHQRFMLHYNFPPYCVGETGMMGSPKRREIGHGKLAHRAINAVLPTEEEFPYVLRVVSEITESNGSSSMASVCGTSLALMDAGVPIKAPVAGIAMGLVKEGERHCVLSDILGDEDHLGDMDFKVAGTAKGVTALQMDIKITGINKDIMEQALAQANQGRMHILGVMNDAIDSHRTDMSLYAPRIEIMKIHPDKIRDVIGRGGATIQGITKETGVSIDIDDDGSIKLFSPDGDAAEQARRLIKRAIADVEVGEVIKGKVQRIVDFGAFVSLTPNKDGLVHISEIAHERVKSVTDYLSEGQEVEVKVLDIDQQGRVKLSMKVLLSQPATETDPNVEQNTEE